MQRPLHRVVHAVEAWARSRGAAKCAIPSSGRPIPAPVCALTAASTSRWKTTSPRRAANGRGEELIAAWYKGARERPPRPFSCRPSPRLHDIEAALGHDVDPRGLDDHGDPDGRAADRNGSGDGVPRGLHRAARAGTPRVRIHHGVVRAPLAYPVDGDVGALSRRGVRRSDAPRRLRRFRRRTPRSPDLGAQRRRRRSRGAFASKGFPAPRAGGARGIAGRAGSRQGGRCFRRSGDAASRRRALGRLAGAPPRHRRGAARRRRRSRVRHRQALRRVRSTRRGSPRERGWRALPRRRSQARPRALADGGARARRDASRGNGAQLGRYPRRHRGLRGARQGPAAGKAP